KHTEAGNARRLVGRLSFGCAEVRRNGDDSPGTGVRGRRGDELPQDERGDGLGGVALALDDDRRVGPHQALDECDAVVRVDRQVFLGFGANRHWAAALEVAHGGGGALSEGIRHYDDTPSVTARWDA